MIYITVEEFLELSLSIIIVDRLSGDCSSFEQDSTCPSYSDSSKDPEHRPQIFLCLDFEIIDFLSL
jgi:hypothetical protein